MTTENPRKRNRPTLVCNNCRRKKTKCNRETPCSNCVKTKLESTCSYSGGNSSNGPVSATAINSMLEKEVANLKHKIKELEASITVASMRDHHTCISQKPTLLTTSYLTGHDVEPPSKAITVKQESYFIGGNSKINSKRLIDEGYFPLDATINFYKEFFNSGSFPGKLNRPLPLLSLARGDPGIQMILKFKDQMIRKMSHSITKYSTFELNNRSVPITRSKKLHKNESSTYQAGFLDNMGVASSNRLSNDIQPLNDYGKFIGVIHSNIPLETENESKSLTEQVLSVLPNRKVFWLLIDRFFKYVYLAMPILDESSFRNEVERLLGVRLIDEQNFTHLNLRENQDWLFMAMILIMCRLSYLSVFHPSVKLNERIFMSTNSEVMTDKQYLMVNGIPMETIKIAELCLRQIDVTRKPTLVAFQAYYMLKAYRSHAPEEGDRSFGGDIEVMNGLLLHMAYSLNLDRDPDCLEFSFDERTKNLRRKIWHILVNADFMDSILSGNTFSSRINYFDTKLPFLTPGGGNLYDEEVESQIIQAFHKSSKLRNASINVLSIMLKMGDTSLTHFLHQVQIMEDSIDNELGNLDDYKDFSNYNVYKIIKLFIFLHMLLFVCTVNYGLFLYFEQKDNAKMKFIYFKKLVITTTNQISNFLYDLLNQDNENFVEGSFGFFAPLLTAINHNFCLIWASFMIRIISTKREFLKVNQGLKLSKENEEYLQTIDQVLEGLQKCRPKDAAVTSILANSYYVGWKMKRIHFFAYKLLLGDEIYEFGDSNTKKVVLKNSTQDFKELVLLLNDTKIESTNINYSKCGNFNSNANKDEQVFASVEGEDIRSDAFWIQILSQNSKMESPEMQHKNPDLKPIEQSFIDDVKLKLVNSSLPKSGDVQLNNNIDDNTNNNSNNNNLNPNMEQNFTTSEDQAHLGRKNNMHPLYHAASNTQLTPNPVPGGLLPVEPIDSATKDTASTMFNGPGASFFSNSTPLNFDTPTHTQFDFGLFNEQNINDLITDLSWK